MKKLSLGFLLLTFFLGTMNVSLAQFQVNQKVKFKTFKKPKKDLCKFQIFQEIKKSSNEFDVDWEFDENECKIFAVPPRAKAGTVVVGCTIKATVTLLTGTYLQSYHTTQKPCLFPDIKSENVELLK